MLKKIIAIIENNSTDKKVKDEDIQKLMNNPHIQKALDDEFGNCKEVHESDLYNLSINSVVLKIIKTYLQEHNIIKVQKKSYFVN